MKIRQLLAQMNVTQVDTIHPAATLRETAQKLVACGASALMVTDDTGAMLGIVSERDLIHLVARYDADAIEQPVSGVMVRAVITCDPADEMAGVLRQMKASHIRHMPVLEHGKLVGMLGIRELTTAYELLEIEANTDPLTDLSNRRPFLKTLGAEFARARRHDHPLSVAMIDIDHFKRVNDTYGHDVGDTVLRKMSRMLISEFRTIDLIGRLGGEEFAVVFPETGLAGAKIACERFRAGVERARISVDGAIIQITVSIGMAEAGVDSRDGPDVLKQADRRLYDAKNGGRNRIVATDS